MAFNLRLPEGGKIAYEVAGDGPPLVLVSGLGGRGSFWRPVRNELARAFTVVTYDHLGTGRSSRVSGPFSVAGMAADLLCLLAELGCDRSALVGHSTGGAILQELALARPEKVEQLVLSATWAQPCVYFRALFDSRLAVLRAAGYDEYRRMGALLQYPPYWIRANEQAFAAELESALPANVAQEEEITQARIQAVLAHDRLEDLAGIDAPTLVIAAADDMIVPAYHSEILAERIPRAKLALLPRGGHFMPHTEPRAYLDALFSFLPERAS
ncbi:alpha/beta fold hydrolase [Rhodoligotrophos defluvii]|uniref:alpha/beta fold hydrolase n=1 Tax=Rhodoligotrophos defluvii TaxID=2561934 RepID=UPI0010C9591A|nr:alpha/beta fold hydrolase [Rhodoligotrophos defluvii]